MTADQERAAIVRFIRLDAKLCERLAAKLRDGSMPGELNARNQEHLERVYAMLADAIERGDHHKDQGHV